MSSVTRPKALFPLAIIPLVALVVLTTLVGREARPISATLTGFIDGHAFSVEGNVGVNPVNVNRIDLMPNGTTSVPSPSTVVPLNVNQPPVIINGTSATVTCAGVPSGVVVSADCTSEIQGFQLDLIVSGTTIVTANVLRSESHSSDNGSGETSNSTGTTFTNLCIQVLTPPLACTPVGPGANQVFPISIPLVANGSITVQSEVPRTMEGLHVGSGLTVTMLVVNLTTDPGGVPINLRIAESDTFVGDVIATFTVNKDFVPNDPANVNVTLSCTSGTVTVVDATASESDPADFTVDGFSAGATCTATETVPPGYAANSSDCMNVPLVADGVCTIVNTFIPTLTPTPTPTPTPSPTPTPTPPPTPTPTTAPPTPTPQPTPTGQTPAPTPPPPSVTPTPAPVGGIVGLVAYDSAPASSSGGASGRPVAIAVVLTAGVLALAASAWVAGRVSKR